MKINKKIHVYNKSKYSTIQTLMTEWCIVKRFNLFGWFFHIIIGRAVYDQHHPNQTTPYEVLLELTRRYPTKSHFWRFGFVDYKTFRNNFKVKLLIFLAS